MQDFIKINDNDNVVVALKTIPAGEILRVSMGKTGNVRAGGCEESGSPAGTDDAENGSPEETDAVENGSPEETDAVENGSPGETEDVENRYSLTRKYEADKQTETLDKDMSDEEKSRNGAMKCVVALEEIPAGHKMAICDIPEGGEVIKYGYRIGNAKKNIKAGAWIHTHNLKTALGDLLEYTYEPVFPACEGQNAGAACRQVPETGGQTSENGEGGSRVQNQGAESDFEAESLAAEQGESTAEAVDRTFEAEDAVESMPASGGKAAGVKESDLRAGKSSGQDGNGTVFMGFRRPDGQVGVRNEIWIIPTVGCVNNVASAIANRANAKLASQEGSFDRGSVDEVIAFPHPYGCSQMGEDQEHTRQILADLVNHPNAGGVLVLGLGCENSNIEVLKPYIGGYDENRVKFLVSQDCEDEVEEALEIIEGLISYVSSFKREPVSVDRLVIGMKCGGSDGLSGITANPLVGRFSDRLIAEGGTTILTEVPEMFGAETILMNRCANEELFHQTVALINDFKNYFKSHNQTIYENPSPGNKKGGISTLEDKSLGCTQKSGSAPVMGVMQYGERVRARGLNLLSAPGNDLVAATALAAAGAQIVLFTTGRGTPFASPVPTVKISTNSALAGKKSNWIDYNAGVLVEDKGMEEEAERLFEYVVEVASGKKVCSEEAGYHDMAIFKQGVTL